MMKYIKNADEYYDNLNRWQQEVLFLRDIVLGTGLAETIKWGGPVYTWHHENVIGVAAFKSYAGLWFFQGALLKDEFNLLVNANEINTKSMRQMRIFSIHEIKPKIIEQYIFESIENFKSGVKIKPILKKPLIIPALLNEAFDKDNEIQEKWNLLSLSYKRDFVQYIQEAKREETQIKRMEKIIPLICQGKGLNDKYK